jgi:hypothetical protein
LSSQLAHETCPECNGDGVVEKGTDEVREKSESAFTNSRRCGLREKACRLTRGKAPSWPVVLASGSKSGRLLFLRSGAVEVIKDGERIA